MDGRLRAGETKCLTYLSITFGRKRIMLADV